MTVEELKRYDIFDLHELRVQIMNELGSIENTANTQTIIQEKKEYLLMLNNAILLKKLEQNPGN